MKRSTEAENLHYDLHVYGRVDLVGEWQGYKVRGKDLVSPTGQRIPRRRLEGLLWRESMELRLAGFASRKQAEADRKRNQSVKVVIVPLAQFLDGRKIGAA